MNAGDASDIVTYRTRSTGGFAFTKEWVRNTLLSICHNTINAFLKRVLYSTTWTLTPDKPVYDLDIEFTDCHEIVSIRSDGKLLSQLKDFKNLFGLDLYWFRHSGSIPKLWSQVGHHFACIFPQPKLSKTVDIVYVKDLQPFIQDEDVLELPDEDIPFCLDLAEIILLVSQARGEKLNEAQVKLQSFMERYGIASKAIQDRSEPKVG